MNTTTEGHVHHFRIASPSGPKSTGVCTCGETRTYHTSFDGLIAARAVNRNPGAAALAALGERRKVVF